MEEYQDKSGLTSLRGTLIPKTLNKLISKIPLLGDIIIPKEVESGINILDFITDHQILSSKSEVRRAIANKGFKINGQKGKIKTTINPIRTLTPRFIQKIIDKNKAIN